MIREVNFDTIATVKELPTNLAQLTVKEIIEIAEELKKSPIEIFETILSKLETNEEFMNGELTG